MESFKASEERVLIFWHVEEDLPELWDLYGSAIAIGAGDVEASTFGERERERENQISKDATERTASGEASLTPSIFTSWSSPSTPTLLRLGIVV